MTHPPPQLRGPALQEIDDPRRPHRDRKVADGTARVKSTTDSFLYSRHRTTPSAQLLSFCLLSTLEIIVGLQEEKPSTLPIADRTCLL